MPECFDFPLRVDQLRFEYGFVAEKLRLDLDLPRADEGELIPIRRLEISDRVHLWTHDNRSQVRQAPDHIFALSPDGGKRQRRLGSIDIRGWQ